MFNQPQTRGAEKEPGCNASVKNWLADFLQCCLNKSLDKSTQIILLWICMCWKKRPAVLWSIQQVTAKTGQIKEHLIRQKEGFILRGFRLEKSENWEKIST